MVEINWEQIHAEAVNGESESPDSIPVNEDDLALSAVALVDRRPSMNRLRAFVEELPYIAQGYSSRESAELQNLSPEAVSTRRRRAKDVYHAATTSQLVVASIQHGHLKFVQDPEPKDPRLTAKQRDVLHMLALGLNWVDIADFFGIQEDRVQTHYESIRHKLGARNMNHAMLRAFQLGIFEQGKKIPTPEELVTKSRLTLSVAGKELGTDEMGILEPTELELLEAMGSLGMSIFDQHQLFREGFLSSIESETVRSNKYKWAMGDLRRKLNEGVGLTILDRGRIAGQRVYLVSEPIEITSGERSYVLPAYTDDDMTIAHRARSNGAKRRRRRKTPKISRLASAENQASIPGREPSQPLQPEPKPRKEVGINVFAD